MKIVDLQLNIDGLIIEDVEKFIQKIEKISNTSYPIKYDILYEEELED